MYKAQILSSQQIDQDTLSTESTNLRYIDNYAVQVDVTAVNSPTDFSVKLQGSNDDEHWNDISGTSNNITGTGPILINQVDDGFKYVRAQFNRTSGTVTASILITGRERRV